VTCAEVKCRHLHFHEVFNICIGRGLQIMYMILWVIFNKVIMYNKHCQNWMPTRILLNMETQLVSRSFMAWSVFSVKKGILLYLQNNRMLDSARESFRESILDVQVWLSTFCVLWPKCCVLACWSGNSWVWVGSVHQNIKLIHLFCELKEVTRHFEHSLPLTVTCADYFKSSIALTAREN
jgi:hypothetical protein